MSAIQFLHMICLDASRERYVDVIVVIYNGVEEISLRCCLFVVVENITEYLISVLYLLTTGVDTNSH